MAYKLEITDHADELLNNLVYHLIFALKSEQAASHLLDAVDHIYVRLMDNPAQFPICRDEYLAAKGYHYASLSDMNYLVVFEYDENTVRVMGIFQELKNYPIVHEYGNVDLSIVFDTVTNDIPELLRTLESTFGKQE